MTHILLLCLWWALLYIGGCILVILLLISLVWAMRWIGYEQAIRRDIKRYQDEQQ